MSATSPLTEYHKTANAELISWQGHELPAHFTGADAEVAAARAGAALFDLAHVGLVEMVGPDTRRFANGMFTNNIRGLQPGQGNRNGMADDRGRLMALLDVYCLADERFLAVLEGVTPEWFYERIDRYIIMDDVELEHRSEQLKVLTLQGPDAAEMLQKIGAPAPEQGLAPFHDAWVAQRDRSGLGGFDLIIPAGTLPRAWEMLIQAGAFPSGILALERLRIAAGKPRWPVDMTDKSFAHEMRLDEEICAFNKGCYLGQEVINRMDTMGKLTKKLYGLTLDGPPPPAGAAVELDGKAVGAISSTVTEGEGARALAILRKAAWEVEVVQIRAEGYAAEARVSDLPFDG